MGLLIFVILFGTIPLINYLIFKRKLKHETTFIEPFLWLVAFASLYEFFGTILLQINCNFWFRIYILLSFLSLLYFFYQLFNKKYKSFFVFFIMIFFSCFVSLIFVWNNSNNLQSDSFLNTIQTITILSFSMIWFKNIFTNLQIEYLWKSPVFYFISGMVIYYFGTLFLFLLSDIIYKNDKSSLQEYWMINIFLNFIFRLLLIIGIWKGRVK